MVQEQRIVSGPRITTLEVTTEEEVLQPNRNTPRTIRDHPPLRGTDEDQITPKGLLIQVDQGIKQDQEAEEMRKGVHQTVL